jgi:hypothetical protein
VTLLLKAGWIMGVPGAGVPGAGVLGMGKDPLVKEPIPGLARGTSAISSSSGMAGR